MVDVDPGLFEHFAVFLLHAEVEQVVSQACADKELHGHIINFFFLLLGAAILENAVLLCEKLPHDRAKCTVGLLFRCILQTAAEKTAQRVLHRLFGVDGQFRASGIHCLF